MYDLPRYIVNTIADAAVLRVMAEFAEFETQELTRYMEKEYKKAKNGWDTDAALKSYLAKREAQVVDKFFGRGRFQGRKRYHVCVIRNYLKEHKIAEKWGEFIIGRACKLLNKHCWTPEKYQAVSEGIARRKLTEQQGEQVEQLIQEAKPTSMFHNMSPADFGVPPYAW